MKLQHHWCAEQKDATFVCRGRFRHVYSADIKRQSESCEFIKKQECAISWNTRVTTKIFKPKTSVTQTAEIIYTSHDAQPHKKYINVKKKYKSLSHGTEDVRLKNKVSYFNKAPLIIWIYSIYICI